MPFDDNEEEVNSKKDVSLKEVSAVKSVFDKNKKTSKAVSPQEFDEKATNVNKKSIDYKTRAADLASQFKKILVDKTLPQNRNIFSNEIEKEVIINMISLASEINEDDYEPEGSGSLGWITVLLKSCLFFRDKINILEYSNLQLEKKVIDLSDKIELLQQRLDKSRQSE